MIALALVCTGLFCGELPEGDSRAAGLRGLVNDHGRWVSPDEVLGRDREDARLSALLAEYNARRSDTPGTAEGQRALAQWCDRVGLEAEAIAHFTAVTRLEPDDAEARRRLGYRRHRGRWMTIAEVAAESSEADAQARADREWGPKIATWRRWLNEPEHRAEAIRGLAGIRDPRAVPALRRSFGDRGSWEQAWAIRVLGHVDSARSSQVLAELSVFGSDETVRLAALRQLVRRDPRTFVGMLINWLRDPIRYEVVPASGPIGVGTLRVEGESSIVERSYTAAPSTNPGGPRTDQVTQLGSDGRPFRLNRLISPAEPVADDARRAIGDRQREDTRSIDRSNVSIELTNARVELALESVTGMDLGQSREAWAGWWTSELGYSYESPKPPAKPVVSEDVRVTYTPRPPVATFSPAVGSARHSCFAAGTSVLSRTGPRPIEQLRVGDQVLTQDPTTGVLGFRPILAVFHNKPASTLRVTLRDETIVATPIHRFWRAGEGWTMARDLRPGDRVRLLGGLSEVVSIARDEVQPVFNLEVAGGHSFFVGKTRALVHDNSLVMPTTEPFDAGIAVANGPGR
jgi:hypothetical protein